MRKALDGHIIVFPWVNQRADGTLVHTEIKMGLVHYEGRQVIQSVLRDVTEARQRLLNGEFPPGSMGPKIESAIDFIENGGEECIITSTEKCSEAVEGSAGTHIVAAWGNRSLAFNAP